MVVADMLASVTKRWCLGLVESGSHQMPP